ncbi:hypothetical protein ACFQ7F_41845 [Streptomyces sp. NPDC056486]|uniref:hypothetical protein n=1 Tax=Streptomyces sp. NPDC056486 TaxID=3345835 RepID=UPI00369B8142
MTEQTTTQAPPDPDEPPRSGWPLGPFVSHDDITDAVNAAAGELPASVDTGPAAEVEEDTDVPATAEDSGGTAPTLPVADTIEKSAEPDDAPDTKSKPAKPKRSRKPRTRAKGKKRKGSCACCGGTGGVCSCQCPIRGPHEHDAATCCACCSGAVHAPADEDQEQPEPEEEDTDQTAKRVVRLGGAIKSLESLTARRWLAAKYVTGTVLGWSIGLDDLARDALFATHANPGNGLGAACSVAAVPVAFIVLARLTARLRVPVPLDWIVCLAGTGYLAEIANGYGYAAAGYMTAHGWDAPTLAPLAIGCALPVASWWVIDRRTQRWAVHWPGRVLHWASTLVTGSALLGLAYYLPNA